MLNLLRIARITADTNFEEKANEINKVFSNQIKKYPAGFTQFLIALDFAFGPSYEIILTGDKDNENAKQFLSIIEDKFVPNKIILFAEEKISKTIPYITNYEKREERITVYVCENYVCNLPATDPEKLRRQLD
jgi:uncharacterized protein YyaL (SSP411 family)